MTTRPMLYDLSPAASTAWDALQGALTAAEPSCRDDARFTADALSPRDQAALATVCADCPLLDPCSAFADTMPRWSASGLWAGQRRGTVRRPDYARRREAVPA